MISSDAQYADWHQFFEDSSASPQAFYQSLKRSVEEHKVPDASTVCIDFLERGMLSPKRVYVQIKRDWLTYRICLAPFGTGFFVSSRLLSSNWNSWPLLLIPVFLMPVFPFITYMATILVLQSFPVAFILGCFAVFPSMGFFLLAVALWYMRCRMTSYRLDTMAAFQEAIHRLLIAEVNKIIETGGRKPLSAEESKPVLHKLLRR
jgi:hypothetical protein